MAGNRGRKIDTWKITADGQTHEIPVYLEAGYGGKETRFATYLHSPEEKIRETNFDELRRKTEQAIKLRKGLTWERFIYVIYEGGSSQPERSDDGISKPNEKADANGLQGKFRAQSKIAYEIVEIAKLADGTQCHRFLDRRRYGREVWDGAPETGILGGDEFEEENPEAKSLIPFTAENMQALQSIRDRFFALDARLRELLAPEKIQKTLNAAGDKGLRKLFFEPPAAKRK